MFRAWIAFVALSLSPALALAAPFERADSRCPTIAALSAYVAQMGGFDRLDVCPPVVFSPTARGAEGFKQDRGAARIIGATYYPETGTIQLSARTGIQSIEGMAQLVHELVHVYQYANGLNKEVHCKEALEPQAFGIQIAFLRDNGFEGEAKRLEQLVQIRGHCPMAGERMQ